MTTPQALFADEKLPFPPVPAHLAALLRPHGKAVFSTRPLEVTPYGLEHFLREVESDPGLPMPTSWGVRMAPMGPG